ncbi:hypothetical protein [Profundibacterium mesophilum]|uniref:Uncharacterized protein n=1 Tax=Profundibacterium mesophilum KAUST100406-0324 TaxID=1037889 RepID=A0A921TBZ4_9RHOB|nr:hypothetical protein [Profundibacterium mesophilum]KAF0675058.1 hypothetical protein PMES_02579 [Profundibacterium mesophilum KAUST100406-0324]
MEYIKPRSLTFWAGTFSVLAGLVIGLHEARPIGWPGELLGIWTGGVGSYVLITNGLGLIGIRRALGR